MTPPWLGAFSRPVKVTGAPATIGLAVALRESDRGVAAVALAPQRAATTSASNVHPTLAIGIRLVGTQREPRSCACRAERRGRFLCSGLHESLS